MTELFAVHDAAAARFVDPFCAPTLEMALRGFREQCETPDTQFAKFPEDYSLWHVGGFDPENGTLFVLTPTKVAMAGSFVRRGVALTDTDVEGLYEGKEVDRA